MADQLDYKGIENMTNEKSECRKRTTLTLLLIYLISTAMQCPAKERNFYAEGGALVKANKFQEAAEVFLKGVEAGDAASMDYLGWLYLEGKGVRKSGWIAYGYFREGAELGSSQACRNLGNMYYQSRTVDQSTDKAVEWWEKAAELSSQRAAFSMATVLYTGTGISQNRERAVKIWSKSAKAGHMPSVIALSFAKAGGDLSKIDKENLLKQKVAESTSGKALLRLLELNEKHQLDYYIPIAFEKQAWNFCAVASTAHILKSSGVKTSQFDIARRVSPSIWGKGSHWANMQKVAESYNHKLEIKTFPANDIGFEDGCRTLISELKEGRPVVIDTLTDLKARSAHTVILAGYSADKGEFIIRDSAQPFPGIRVVSRDEFKRIWNSIGFLPTNHELKRACMILAR